MTIKVSGIMPEDDEELWDYYNRIYPEAKIHADTMKDDILNPQKISGGAKCPKCAQNSLFTEGIQLRGLDEGQSEITQCKNCGFTKVNR